MKLGNASKKKRRFKTLSLGTINLKIDGIEVTVSENIMILKAAKDNGIAIPPSATLKV